MLGIISITLSTDHSESYKTVVFSLWVATPQGGMGQMIFSWGLPKTTGKQRCLHNNS